MNIVVILLLSAVTYTAANGSCPGDWIYLEGACYKFSSQAVTWEAAKSDCENMGSMLAVVNSDRKQDAIANLLNGQNHWIGLYKDPEDTSNWLWVDQSQFCSGLWSAGEPNNLGGHEDCVEMRPAHSGLWNDAPCSLNRRYVCEMNACSGISVECQDQEMVITVPQSTLQELSCSPTKKRELSEEDVVLFSAKGPIHPSREKRVELEQSSVYVKRGSAQVPVKTSADGSTA